jgi:hypothetical protein
VRRAGLLGLALLVAACPGPPNPPATKEVPMVPAIERVARLVCRDPLPAGRLATDLGSVLEDLGGNLQIRVRPNDGAFSSAEVTREFGTGETAGVRVVLARPVALNELQKAFGAPREGPRLHPEDPVEVVFPAIARSSPHLAAALVAEVRDGRVFAATIRRDKL